MLKQDFCDKFLAEIDNYFGSGLPVRRPNNMHNYGLIVNEIGMENSITALQQAYACPDVHDTHTHTHTHTCPDIHDTHTHTHTHTHILMCTIHTHTHTYTTRYRHKFQHTYIYIHIHKHYRRTFCRWPNFSIPKRGKRSTITTPSW
jgi:hypothetical protein